MGIANSVNEVLLKIFKKGFLQYVLQPYTITWTEQIGNNVTEWSGSLSRYLDKTENLFTIYPTDHAWNTGTFMATQSNISGSLYLGYS